MDVHVSNQETISSSHSSQVTDIDQPLPDGAEFSNLGDWATSNAASQHRFQYYPNDGATWSYMDSSTYPYARDIEVVGVESVGFSVFLLSEICADIFQGFSPKTQIHK